MNKIPTFEEVKSLARTIEYERQDAEIRAELKLSKSNIKNE